MINPVPADEWVLLQPLVGTSMLELGNKKQPAGTFKAFFEHLGYRHVSVDLNGLDGALPLDLQDPLDLGRFDMVTNFGTTEHVIEQEPVWRNIVEAAGMVIVSTTPKPGDWKHHGRWYPEPGFYGELARLNGFAIETLCEYGKTGRRMIGVRLRRERETEFVMPEGLMHHNPGGKFVGRAG